METGDILDRRRRATIVAKPGSGQNGDRVISALFDHPIARAKMLRNIETAWGVTGDP
jgi:hypothetical protein